MKSTIAVPSACTSEAKGQFIDQLREEYRDITFEFVDDPEISLPAAKKLETEGRDLGNIEGDTNLPGQALIGGIHTKARKLYKDIVNNSGF